MLQNYFKITLRNIRKHKMFSAINIFGMSIGIAACLLILLYVTDELSYDRFHTHADRIYQVGLQAKIGDQDLAVANTCPPMAEALVREVPGVEQATRIANERNLGFDKHNVVILPNAGRLGEHKNAFRNSVTANRYRARELHQQLFSRSEQHDRVYIRRIRTGPYHGCLLCRL